MREDLRLLVMSATLDGARVRALLGEAPLIESEGRAYPVETRYVGRNPGARIEDEVARVTLAALAEESGSILVFLPGQGEIRRVAEMLEARIRRPEVDVAPLYGAMDARAQDLAVAPASAGRRKIVLATSIAETSLTIEGVRVVVDSGLMRVPRYEPDIGLTRLETVRVSKANADQRRGRAGRVEPGVCYRLWEEAANGGLRPYAAPEILSADLSGFVLDCAAWGVADPMRLAFLDPPPRGALTEARALLTAIGALDGEGRITDEGRAISSLALPPRLARMVVDAARAGDARTAGEVAVLLTERGLGGDAVDLTSRLEAFRRDRSQRADEARRLARSLAQRARSAPFSPREKVAGAAGRMRAEPPTPSRRSPRLRLSRPDRDRPRQARRVSDGERARGCGRAPRRPCGRTISRDRRDRRTSGCGAHSARCAFVPRGYRDGRLRFDRDGGRNRLRPRLRRVAGEAPPPARGAHPRRADARRPARTMTQRSRWRAAFFRSASSASPGAKPSSNGATG